jgi:hypothetical protein
MKCWFCSVRDAEPEDAFELDMYGEIDAKSTEAKTNVAYSVRHVIVPRCPDCKSKHWIAKVASWFAALFLVGLLAALLSMLFAWVGPLAAGLWCGLAAGLIIAALLSGAFVQKGIRRERASKSGYPEIKELLNECYRFGKRPSQVIPKSDPPCEHRNKEDSGSAQNVQP